MAKEHTVKQREDLFDDQGNWKRLEIVPGFIATETFEYKDLVIWRVLVYRFASEFDYNTHQIIWVKKWKQDGPLYKSDKDGTNHLIETKKHALDLMKEADK